MYKGEQGKKLYFPVWGESQQDDNPSCPPPPPQSGGSSHGGPAKMTHQDLPRPANYHMTGGGGKRGRPATFQNTHYWRIISRNLFHTIDMHSLSLPYWSVKVCLSPFYELWENVSYVVTQAYKRPAKTTRHSHSATPHSTGSENKNKASHNSTCGTVSSLLFFLLKLLLHTVYIFNIFVWTEVIDSRRL